MVEPDLELSERLRRMETIDEVFRDGKWFTAEQLNELQATPSADKSHPASDWKRQGLIFGVTYRGEEYFAAYQFDADYQPLPVIREILAAYGEVTDTWKLAAWFHFPNAWLVREVNGASANVPPKDVLDQASDVVRAAGKRGGTYVA